MNTVDNNELSLVYLALLSSSLFSADDTCFLLSWEAHVGAIGGDLSLHHLST